MRQAAWDLGFVTRILLGIWFGGFSLVATAGAQESSPPAAAPESAARQFTLIVTGPDGNPVADASVEVRRPLVLEEQHVVQGRFERALRYGALTRTDAAGRLTIRIDQLPPQLAFAIRQPGYGPYWAAWRLDGTGAGLPPEFTVELERGWTAGGIVVDDKGAPVEGVRVAPSIEFKKRPGDAQQLGSGYSVTTDAQGKWKFETMPESLPDVSINFSHANLRPMTRSVPRNGFELLEGQEPSARIEMSRGLVVLGVVMDEAGRPVVGARVRTRIINTDREALTDADGIYTLSGFDEGQMRLVVSAPGKALDFRDERVTLDMPPVNFILKPGRKLRIRIVDDHGQAIPRGTVFFQRWRGDQVSYFEFNHLPRNADDDGVWEWNEAPEGDLAVDVGGPGRLQLSNVPVVAREEEYVIAPPLELVISGKVVDAVTKAPVKSFLVTPGISFDGDRISWQARDAHDSENGQYVVRKNYEYPSHLVKVEAPGYRIATSRAFKSNEGAVTFDFELQPAEDITGVVLTPAGAPAVRARVALNELMREFSLRQGDLNDRQQYGGLAETDARGQFRLPPRAEQYHLFVTHPEGFAYVAAQEGPASPRITLTPWARIEGTFRVGAELAPNVSLDVSQRSIEVNGSRLPYTYHDQNVTTGADGRFRVDRAFPGIVHVGRRIIFMVNEGAREVSSSVNVGVRLTPGETAFVEVGGTGRAVVGHLLPQGAFQGMPQWNFASLSLHRKRENLPARIPEPPPELAGDQAQIESWYRAWRATDEGRAYQAAQDIQQQLRELDPYCFASADRFGRFRIDDVPPGEYTLGVSMREHPGGNPGELRAFQVTVPPVPDGKLGDAVDLGIIRLEP